MCVPSSSFHLLIVVRGILLIILYCAPVFLFIILNIIIIDLQVYHQLAPLQGKKLYCFLRLPLLATSVPADVEICDL